MSKEKALANPESVEEKPDDKTPDEQANSISIEEIAPLTQKVTVEIPGEKIANKLDDRYTELSGEVVIPGFRKGRAPRRLIEKRMGKELGEDVKVKLIAEAVRELDDRDDFKPLTAPDVDIEEIEMPETGPMSFTFEVEVYPAFELPELTGIPLTRSAASVDDKMVNDAVDNMLRRRGSLTPAEDRPVREDDVLTADVTIKNKEQVIATHPSETVYAKASGLVKGVLVEKLLESLEGAGIDETRSYDVKLPESFTPEEYAGKKAQLEITVREIKYIEPAKINDDLLSELGYSSEEDLRSVFRSSLEHNVEQETQQDLRNKVRAWLREKLPFELPPELLKRQSSQAIEQMRMSLINRGKSEDEAEEEVQKLETSGDETGPSTRVQNELREFFIIHKIAEEKEIVVSEDELNGAIGNMARMYNRRFDRMRMEMEESGRLETLNRNLLEGKVLDQLIKDAKITDAPAESDSK